MAQYADEKASAKDGVETSVFTVDEQAERLDLAQFDFTEEESRRIVRKFDWHVSDMANAKVVGADVGQILPFIWWCYLFNSLDRSNVSNAKSDGMTSAFSPSNT